MSFSITPRVFSVLCLAVASVAGQWSGNYNTTSVPRRLDPAAKCWIKSLAQRPYTAIYPCTCTGGEVWPDCNWQDALLFNAVRNADCRCATTGDLQNEPESLKAYGQKKPNAVTQCLCDPVAGNEADTDGLVVPAPDCWCPAQSLKEKSGLSEAKESQVVPETPPCGASIQQCRDELNKSGHPPKNVCQHLMQYKPTEISEPLKSRLPNCSISSLTEVCKGI
ncbi:hypothetical protein J3458_020649 [Metarhizium acridum]|uniref:Uncharacterized protein n=1 Tax=Metarhizium acridum (strain CQMa 102) TaxID=655827 RepID=E9EIZ4_METAQ|nr:uncharacterized protein MAC_09842 [Metarhizium acridum CQMa 102]EFY84114.1 hypothetical protein MAC_09842 [Metarhizium acridum CQMa 102]KAG8407155.1 hypothetical protein J3458_020649 [Metarhizium acridum]